MADNVEHSVKDLEELLTDAVLSSDTTALDSSQVVNHLNAVASERTLEPLQHIEEASRAVAEVHREVDQIETS